MSYWLLAIGCWLTGFAQAAIIRGTVVENLTGKSLARAVVVLQPIAGTPGEARSMRTTRFGGFEFEGLAAGAYVLKASRKGFMAMEYGQKRWNSAGMPVAIEENATLFLNFRLPRYSAINGTLVDEEEIGLPNHDVSAYRYGAPLELVTQARTDDRGMYRLYGLTPGTYVVRTAGQHYEEGDYLPTFAHETERVEQARQVELLGEYEAHEVDVRPLPGRLYTMRVATGGFQPPADLTITLASEMGRRSVKATSFTFTGLAPGEYEVYAEAPADPETGLATEFAYQRLHLKQDAGVSLLAQPGSSFSINGGPREPGEIRLRRRDMAGTGPVLSFPASRRASIPTGRWDVMMRPAAGYYVSGAMSQSRNARADGWQEYQSPGYLRFTLSGGPSAIRGIVKSAGDPVAGAPVYLEGWDTVSKARVGDLRAVRTDMRGQYAFPELAPGTYRLLSTFEYAAPGSEQMEAAGAASVAVDAHGEGTKDLELYVIR